MVPMAAGGMGPSCLHRIMFFCSGVFCQCFRKSKDFRSGCWLPLGSAIGPRCACRGEADVVRGGRGANRPGGPWVFVPSPHHVLLLCCLLQVLQEGARASGRVALLGSAMGPWCACRGEVAVVWCYDVDMAEDANLIKGDMHLACTPISTPRVFRYRGGY